VAVEAGGTYTRSTGRGAATSTPSKPRWTRLMA